MDLKNNNFTKSDERKMEEKIGESYKKSSVLQMDEKKRQLHYVQLLIERFVLLFFSFISIAFIVMSAVFYSSVWGSIAVTVAYLIPLLLHITGWRDYEFRSYYTTLMIQCYLIVFGMYVEDLYHMFPVMITLVVLVGLYSRKKLLHMFTFTNILLYAMHIIMLRRIDVYADPVSAIFHFLNVEVAIYIVFFWVKKRNDSMENFQKTIKELQEVEHSKDDFLANVSHEIRTPINTICGISDILLQQELKHELREKISYIQTAGRNLSSVVGDILDFSELQSGKVQLEEEHYNITSTLNDVINMTMAKIADKNIELLVDCDTDIPSGLLGDEKKIRRAVMNLVDNAVKFTEEGCIAISVEHRKEEYGINLIISVKDTGIGIEHGKLEELFVSFSQVDTRRNRKKSGLGLGLAITRILVQKMGGVVNVKSVEGKGTSVMLVIPQKVEDYTAIVSLDHAEQYNVGVYVNLEQFFMTEVRDEYSKTIAKMIQQLEVRSHVFSNLLELKRRVETEQFSHLFVSSQEYKEDSEYFDSLLDRMNVVVVLTREEDEQISNPKLLRAYRPFYVVSIVNVIKNSMQKIPDSVQVYKKLYKTKDVHILVVDDNQMNLKVVEGFLAKYDIGVSTALSGKAALSLVEENTYDLIFMDHMMPEMDGVETMHHIREKNGSYYRAMPIVALTANAIAGAREMFLEEGFTDFLEKPLERSVLERVLLRNLPEEKLIYDVDRKEVLETTSEEKKPKKVLGEKVLEEQSKEEKKVTEETFATEKRTEDAETTERQKNIENYMRQFGEVSAEHPIEKEVERVVEATLEEKTKQEEPAEEKQSEERVVEEAKEEKSGELVIGDLDIKTGCLYCGGEENLIEILKVCGDTAEENKTNIQNFYEEKNWKEYTILVHGVKSSMKTVGAMKLSEMAKALEMAGKSNDEEFIHANHDAFIAEYNRVDAFVHASPLLYEQTQEQKSTQQQETGKEIEESVFDEKIQIMEEAMYDFDGDKMEEILKELQEYSFGGVPLKKPLSAILRKVEMSDYMSAYDTLVKVKSEMKKKIEKQKAK